MITTTTWIRRGVAAQFPTKYEIDEEEMERISKLARQQLEDAQEDLDEAKQKEKREEEEDVDAMDEDEKTDETRKEDKTTTCVLKSKRVLFFCSEYTDLLAEKSTMI